MRCEIVGDIRIGSNDGAITFDIFLIVILLLPLRPIVAGLVIIPELQRQLAEVLHLLFSRVVLLQLRS